MQRIVIVIILLFLSFFLKGQSNWEISGYVYGEKEAMPFASVYLTPIPPDSLSSKILAFTSTDSIGYFQLTIDSSLTSVLLVCNYLGYDKKEIKVQKRDSFPLIIDLKRGSDQLSEVIVIDQIIPIHEHGDTVIYHASQFRDSTEKNVEELLKKLPGVEIDGNGQIKVNGKPIRKMLIEGTDMFGRQYTIGSQNISADHIASVEIIDHYQENKVIKDIATSEDIVIDLKLKDEVKNKLSGRITEGIGYGEEWKALFDANIFSISKNQKYLLISNNGNTGEQYGINAIRSTYTFGNKDLLTDDIEKTPRLTDLIAPNYLNTEGQSVDNSINTFNTLRNFFTLSPTLKLKLNTTFATQKEAQQTFDNATSLYQNDPYIIITQNNSEFKNRLAKIDLTLNHLSRSHHQSLEFYTSFDNSAHRGLRNIVELNNNKDIFSKVDLKNNKFLASAIYSLKLSTKSVLMLSGKFNHYKLEEQFTGNNDDYNSVLPAPFSFEKIQQDLDLRNSLFEFSTRYLSRLSRFSIQAESKIKTVRFNFSPKWFGTPDSISPFFSIGNISLKDNKDFTWSNQISLSREINSSTIANFSSLVFYRIFEQGELRTTFNFSNTFALKFWLTKTTSNNTKIHADYQYGNNQLNSYDLVSARYINDNYNFSDNVPKTQLAGGHYFNLRFSKNSIKKLSSFYLLLSLRIKEKRWIQNFTFVNSIVNTTPYFIRNNDQFRIVTKLEKFVPVLKTNFEIKPHLLVLKNNIITDGNISRIQVLDVGSGFVGSWRLHHSVLLRLDGFVGKRYFKNDNSINDHLTNFRIVPFVSLEKGTWNIKTVVDYRNSFNNARSAKILSTKLVIEKTISIKNYTTNASLKFYNLLNQKNYKVITAGEFFIFENMIEAISPFFVFSIDQRF